MMKAMPYLQDTTLTILKGVTRKYIATEQVAITHTYVVSSIHM